jgi:hypothetical protein
MLSNQKITNPNDWKLKRQMDSDAIAKDKCYKLGVWLHGEYRKKSKKSADRAEHVNSAVACH